MAFSLFSIHRPITHRPECVRGDKNNDGSSHNSRISQNCNRTKPALKRENNARLKPEMRLMQHKGPLYGQSKAHCSEMRLRCFVSGPLHFLLRFRWWTKKENPQEKGQHRSKIIMI